MGTELPEDDVVVPTDLPPEVTEEDLDVGPESEDSIFHTRVPVIDVEETT